LVGSIVGIVLSGPVGVVALIFSVVGAVVSLVKGIIGFFNHNYRKSQQRKNADQNIESMGEKIYSSVKRSLDEAYIPLESGITDIKNELVKM
jgi:hypothetical protein